MLTQEVFPLVLIQDRHGAQVLDGPEYPGIVDRDGVRLVENQVVGLPLLPEGVIRLVEQGKHVLPVQDPVQDLFGDIDLVGEDVVVVRVLGGDDDTQLIGQRDLGGPHSLHWVAVQRARLVCQKDIGQASIHAVV